MIVDTKQIWKLQKIFLTFQEPQNQQNWKGFIHQISIPLKISVNSLVIRQTTPVKQLFIKKNSDDSYVVVFIRGDLEINETKLVNYLGDQIHAAVITEECGLNAGYIGPVGLHINAPHVVLYDKSLEGRNNLSCGAK